MSEKLNELYSRKKVLEDGGGTALIQKLHGEGKLTARERIERLLDENSFVEFGGFVKQRCTDFNALEQKTPADGVVTGYGTVEARLVFVYSQDSTVLGGSVGEMHAKKIVSVYEQAVKMGAPVVGFLDSEGMRVQEGVDALDAYGKVYTAMTQASGVIPQITAVMGGCMGLSALIPALSDFVFTVDKKSRLFLVSPNTLPGEQGKKGDLSFSPEESGLAHYTGVTEEECIGAMKKLLEYIPSNNMEDSPFFGTNDDSNRTDEFLNSIVPADKTTPLDMKKIITTLGDREEYFETGTAYGKAVTTGFLRMNGTTVGVLGNTVSMLSYHGTDKAVRFVTFCDAFNIPIVSLTDVEGYQITSGQNGIIKNMAKLVHSFAAATVPKINVIVRNGFGSPYLFMNSKHIGADYVFAWPDTQVSVMEAETAVSIMYADEIKEAENALQYKMQKIEQWKEKNSSPYTAASRGFIDDIIEPAATRKRLIAVLEMLASKREGKPAKKHAAFTL